MDWLQIISIIFGVLGGSGALVTYLLYSKQLKRFKNAEAFEKEVQALKAAMSVLEQQITFQAGQITSLQQSYAARDTEAKQLERSLHICEVKNSKNKSVISQAYECTFCPDTSKCPVILQRVRNEQEYLKALEQRNVHNDDTKNGS